jgi:lipopolysaccharide transport system ATP-binding protein
MSDIAIRAEGLGKCYRLGAAQENGGRYRYKSLRDSLANAAAAPLRAFRSSAAKKPAERTAEETFWALQDISFSIKHGEVVGIIGSNGAGKSTLLKILSRITEPTTGRVQMRGRVASLLEVGTGFHPELTGRENIYMNGAILGMARAEIARKFDEIVAFAEIAKFLDTPVKHYSSGMYVRLAFAVAAHLEQEILVLDEVLAVGDTEFQNKCLGKMQDVSRSGRTVLFVSHNMSAVKSLTKRGIVLSGGHIAFDGATDAAIPAYLQLTSKPSAGGKQWGRGTHTAIRAVRMLDAVGEPAAQYFAGEPLGVEVEIETDGAPGMSLEIFLTDASASRLGMASVYHFHGQTLPSREGAYVCRLLLEPMWLASGNYALEVATSVINVSWDHRVESAFAFNVPFSNPLGSKLDFKQSYAFGPLALLSSRQPQFDPIPACQTIDINSNEKIYPKPAALEGVRDYPVEPVRALSAGGHS